MSNDDALLQFFKDASAAYALSTTKENKALSAAYAKLAAGYNVIPPIVVPTGPTGGSPTGSPASPTGPVIPGKTKPITGPQKAIGTPLSGDLASTADGQIIDAQNVSKGYIRIHHNNVTITNFAAKGWIQDPGKTGAKLSYFNLAGDGTTDGAQWNEYNISHGEITGTLDGIKGHGNTIVDNCYIHDDIFHTYPDGSYDHNDSIQISSGSNIKFTNNWVENWKGNAGAFPKADQGPISNVLIDSNYFNLVGNYPIYSLPAAFGLVAGLVITNNVIGARRTDTDSSWGLMLAHIEAASDLIWKNNIFQATGQQILLNAQGEGYLAS